MPLSEKWGPPLAVDVSGKLDASTLQSGGTLSVKNQGVVSGTTITNGGIATISSGGSSVGSIISSGGTLTFTDGGRGSLTSLLPGGTLNIGPNTTYDNEYRTSLCAISGAQINVFSGGTVSRASVGDGGTITIYSGGVAAKPVVSKGGALIVKSGGALADATSLQDGGKATIWGNTGGSIDLVGNTNAGLTISGLENGGVVNTTINGWSGNSPGNSDSIRIPGVSPAGAIYDYPNENQVIITLSNGKKITLNIPGVKTTGFGLYDDGQGGAFAEVCFLAGSMIDSPTGPIAVEEIRVGDTIMTYTNGSSQETRVIWVGRAHCSVRPDYPEDAAGYPVRILKGAIADNVPFKDMLITPEHCLLLDGNLVPARMLVNGCSVFYDHSITDYYYYHIETENHSIMMADGMFTESYLDTGNRRAFQHSKAVN